ncbi:MAG: hypothetical protein EB059_04070 [Alphaproteobacteria bacterium]|nr:hypothetical protein [Alphaproteobacteria bacterium]
MPDDMLAKMLVALGLVLGLLGVITWILKKYGSRLGLPITMRQGRSRLQLLDVSALDARHRLVLVRRDHIEHLLLLGGAQPVVIETGIPHSPSEEKCKETDEKK